MSFQPPPPHISESPFQPKRGRLRWLRYQLCHQRWRHQLRQQLRLGEAVPQFATLTCISLAVGVTTWLLQTAGTFQLLELALFDQEVRWRSPEAGQSHVVLVTVDEQDLSWLGHWPMNDRILAQALNKIKQHQPRLIGLDLYRNLSISPGSEDLQRVFTTTPNLVGIERRGSDSALPDIAAPPALVQRQQVASSNIVLDFDGRVRRNLLSMAIVEGDRAQELQTLGAYLALEYLAVEGIKPEVQANSVIRLGQARFEPLEENAGGYIRADVKGYQTLGHFQRFAQGMPTIRLRDLLEDRVPQGLMQDRIVVVGSVAESLRDQFYTPYTTDASLTWSGMEVHANIAQQIVSAALNGRPLLRAVSERWEMTWVLFWAGAGSGLGWWCQSRRGRGFWLQRSGWFLGAGLVLVGLTHGLFQLNWWMVLVSPFSALLGAGLLSQAYLVWRTLQRSHQAIAAYSKILEVKVQERTQQISEKNRVLEISQRQAEAANQAKSAFLTNMSHEFRTPLTVILGFSELLSRDSALHSEQREQLLAINRSGEHLLSLINDVLEVARMEAGKLQLVLEWFDLGELLQGLAEMFRYKAQLKGLSWHLDSGVSSPCWVRSDQKKLRQILINLLGNALKFTHQGQVVMRVWVEASSDPVPEIEPQAVLDPRGVSAVAEGAAGLESSPSSWVEALGTAPAGGQAQGWLHCEVEDTGIGIASEELTRIFEAFFQTPVGQKLYEGSGLGLAITQQFVHCLGGQIQVFSTLGQGSLFCVKVPVKWLVMEGE